ncbi:hypothetical protein [Algoriphagus boritolerans]
MHSADFPNGELRGNF